MASVITLCLFEVTKNVVVVLNSLLIGLNRSRKNSKNFQNLKILLCESLLSLNFAISLSCKNKIWENDPKTTQKRSKNDRYNIRFCIVFRLVFSIYIFCQGQHLTYLKKGKQGKKQKSYIIPHFDSETKNRQKRPICKHITILNSVSSFKNMCLVGLLCLTFLEPFSYS